MTKEAFSQFAKRSGAYQVRPKDLASLPAQVRYIDVRGADEFSGDLGHLAQAELVPLPQLANVAATWKTDEPLLMICRSGNRSSQAAAALIRGGFTQVANLDGGMLAVRAEGL
jgi:sulfur dioxygenase